MSDKQNLYKSYIFFFILFSEEVLNERIAIIFKETTFFEQLTKEIQLDIS